MKKAFLLLASAALLFAGCAKEQIAGQQDGELTNVTLTANLDNGTTKADADGDGLADNVNRCIMEIYYGDELFARQYAPVNDKTATFTAQVVSNRQYTVAFWADNVDELATDKYYTTTSLKEIAINGSYIGNDDARDAFYVCEPFTVQQAGGSFTATLKRPFAQMNVITTDWDKAASVAGLAPETVIVTLKNVMTAFNAVTGEISAAQDIVYEAAVYTPAANGAEKTISMDYIFASDEKAAIDIDWKALHGTDANVEHSFTAIPYQRNYRTNIKGALLTSQGQWTVTVDSDWTGNGTTVEDGDDPYLVNYFEAGSIAAANEALKTNNAVSIENPSDLGTAIVIPAEQDDKNVLIKISGASTGDIAVKKAVNGPASLAIESDSKTLDIDLPNSHVDVNKGDFTGVTANTSATTLVVGKDVKINTLTINGGNAAIYGLVKASITRASGVKANWYADSREKLIAGLNNSVAGESVVLTSDIDLDNEEWAPVTIGKAITFDGDNHTIKNLKIAGSYSDSHYGLIGYLYSNGVIKNLTIDGAQILLPESKGDSSRGAALVGIARDGDIINCHVKNVKVKAYQKVGGLIGQYSLEASGTSIVKDCSAESVIISENITGDGVWGAGGLIGSLCFSSGGHSIAVEGCSVKGISIANSTTVAAPKQTAHAFIGTIREDAEATATLTGNTVEQTAGLYTDMYTSDYFGWATNPESDPSHKCSIIIDGTPWTPNYPVKNVTKGTSYPTLAKAVAAASAGDEITLENGEYTLPSLSNIIINGIGDNVVVNHSSGSICATSNATIKNVVFNLGQNGYHGFQHASNLVLEGCTFNGFQTTYGSITYKNCTFNQDTYAYNMNAYGAEIVCENCVFNGKGKAVYVYNEGNSEMYHISFNNCVFNEVVGTGTKCKAAILVKENYNNQKYVVNINNSTANFDKYVPDDPDLTGSSLWNMEVSTSVTGTDVTVNVDGQKAYPFTNFKVSDADGLRNAVKMFNKGKENTEYTIELADGTYSVSDLHVKQAAGENKNPRSLLIKATNKGQVVLTPNADTKTHMIFIVSGCSNYYGSEYITFDGLKFSMPTNPGNGVASHAIYCPREPANDPIGKLLGEEVSRYAHNVNVINCELQGFGTADNSLLNAPQGAGINHVTVDNCVVNNAGYVVNGYFVDTKVLNSKITNVKACANTNSQGITVENCEIDGWNDYCIRSNGGPIIVKNNKFNMTFNGEIKVDEPAAIVYLRGANAPVEATISGNTITKAKIEMWDCYCATAWTVNGEAKAAGTGINF